MSRGVDHSERWIDYDYAVVRLVPRVHLCTFINIGVVLHARQEGHIDACIRVNREHLGLHAPTVDLNILERYTSGYMRICQGGADGGMVGLLPPSERFHWLTAPRSAVMQSSPVHPGRCHDLREALEMLYQEHCYRT